MLIIKYCENIEKALKKLKNKVRRTKMIDELRDRKEFEKPSVIKRSQKIKAIYNVYLIGKSLYTT